MQPFRQLIGKAASLPQDNIDTDVIFPARFLTLTAREGLGVHAFADRPFRLAGTPVLVAGVNFGCGSSREQAVWALLDCGVRCVIAPGFGEIFAGNCIRNGMLPIVLGAAQVDALHTAAQAGETFSINLETCTVQAGDAPPVGFAIPEPQRQALLNGWDETAAILAHDGAAIDAFEQRQRDAQPWLYTKG
jgi:3-isopropylmalate/(R)-2-methylmalate dehydratase small subunit